MRPEGLISGATFTNVGGAGGTVGLPQFAIQFDGKGNALMIGGMVMVGAINANQSPVTLADVTPIARLTGEALVVVVVPAVSPFQTLADVVAALTADAATVPVAGGSAGGSDHILLGLIGKSIGVSAANMNHLPFAGGGEALAALLGQPGGGRHFGAERVLRAGQGGHAASSGDFVQRASGRCSLDEIARRRSVPALTRSENALRPEMPAATWLPWSRQCRLARPGAPNATPAAGPASC